MVLALARACWRNETVKRRGWRWNEGKWKRRVMRWRGVGASLLPATSYTYEIIYYLEGELSGAGIELPRPCRSGDSGVKKEEGKMKKKRSGTRQTERDTRRVLRKRQRKKEGRREARRERERRWEEGDIEKSRTAVNEPPPMPSADYTYILMLAMLLAYIRRIREYVSTREGCCLPFIRWAGVAFAVCCTAAMTAAKATTAAAAWAPTMCALSEALGSEDSLPFASFWFFFSIIYFFFFSSSISTPSLLLAFLLLDPLFLFTALYSVACRTALHIAVGFTISY